VPETATKFPILTAREYAATGSHGMPLERRTISAIRGSFSVASGEHRNKRFPSVSRERGKLPPSLSRSISLGVRRAVSRASATVQFEPIGSSQPGYDDSAGSCRALAQQFAQTRMNAPRQTLKKRADPPLPALPAPVNIQWLMIARTSTLANTLGWGKNRYWMRV